MAVLQASKTAALDVQESGRPLGERPTLLPAACRRLRPLLRVALPLPPLPS